MTGTKETCISGCLLSGVYTGPRIPSRSTIPVVQGKGFPRRRGARKDSRISTFQGVYTVLLGCLLWGFSAPAVKGAEFSLVPVSASGAHTIAGNEITLEGGGQRVFFEIFLSGWDPDLDGNPLLKAWQAAIDSAGYSSGLNGTLTPATEACNTDADCAAAFGTGATCTVPHGAGLRCAAGFINTSRTDYVYFGVSSIPLVDISTLNYRFASAVFLTLPVADPGVPRYCGTLVLDVPIDAKGTFTIGFLDIQEPANILIDQNDVFITPVDLTPAVIDVVECLDDPACDDGNPCTDNTCRKGTCFSRANYDTSFFCCNPTDGALCDRPAGDPGDTNGDGRVDILDFADFQRCFGSKPPDALCGRADMDCDCAVNLNDLPHFTAVLTGP